MHEKNKLLRLKKKRYLKNKKRTKTIEKCAKRNTTQKYHVLKKERRNK